MLIVIIIITIFIEHTHKINISSFNYKINVHKCAIKHTKGLRAEPMTKNNSLIRSVHFFLNRKIQIDPYEKLLKSNNLKFNQLTVLK